MDERFVLILLLIFILQAHLSLSSIPIKCVRCMGVEPVSFTPNHVEGPSETVESLDVKDCTEYTYNGGEIQRFEYKKDLPDEQLSFDIIITDIVTKDKIIIGNFNCKVNDDDDDDEMYRYQLDESMDNPVALSKVKGNMFFIKGKEGDSIKFILSDKNSKCCGPCMAQSRGLMKRVIGGVPTGAALPFLVLIRTFYTADDGSQKLYRCAGSIIKPKWILTAGHCLDREFRMGGKDYILDTIEVYSGAYDVSIGEAGRRRFVLTDGSNWHQHPNYLTYIETGRFYKYDVGLIKFTDEDQGLTTIPLHQAKGDLITCSATTAGWGAFNKATGQLSNVIRKLTVNFQPYADCDKLNERALVSRICAKTVDGEGECDGDSGAPAFCQTSDGGFVQLGVFSSSFNDDIGCSINRPSYYVTITKEVKKFIDEKTG